MSGKIHICDVTVHPGEVANLALPLPQQYSCSPLFTPIRVINGTKPGPCLVIFSALNGKELNGLEIVNRIVNNTSPTEISGTIIAIPVLNVYALTHYPQVLPSSQKLVDCFPGNEHGSYGERIAYLITEEVLKKADYCIELQTGELNHNILPQVYCNFGNQKAKLLAKRFKSPVVTNVELNANALRQTTEDLHVPLLVYQAGEAMRFDEAAITLGVSGVQNIMAALKMVSKAEEQEVNPIFSRDEDWVVAHKGGILHAEVSLGQLIEQKDLLGTISDPFGADADEPVLSPLQGVVVGINTSPLVHEGLPVFKIASFLDDSKAESVIEKWDKSQPDSYTV